jgi:hypothetical protein
MSAWPQLGAKTPAVSVPITLAAATSALARALGVDLEQHRVLVAAAFGDHVDGHT